MSFNTDYKRVHGLGSAKDGTHHFWAQRLSAVALIFLTPLFVIPLARNIGADYETVIAAYGHPFRAIVAALFVITTAYHLALGLSVVIEDYAGGGTRTALIIFSKLFCGLIGFVGLFAIAKIAFIG